MTEDSTKDFWDRITPTVVGVAYLLAIASSVSIFGWQVLSWLKHGKWENIPFLAIFELFGENFPAVYHPRQWFGLAKVFQFILDLPLFLCLPCVIVVVANGFERLIEKGDPNKRA